MTDEFKHIVRIAGRDLDGHKKIRHGLIGIKGVSHNFAYSVAEVSGIDPTKRLGDLEDSEIERLNDIILHPEKYNIPSWLYNRRKDRETGKDIHLVMSKLDLAKRWDINRLQKIKSYRGIRHKLGLPCRGQRTKSTFRKSGAVGVVRKKGGR